MPSRDFFTLPHKIQMSTPFLRDKSLKFCRRVECAPAEPFTIFFVFVFFRWKGGILIRPKKLQKPKHLAEKNKNQKHHS